MFILKLIPASTFFLSSVLPLTRSLRSDIVSFFCYGLPLCILSPLSNLCFFLRITNYCLLSVPSCFSNHMFTVTNFCLLSLYSLLENVYCLLSLYQSFSCSIMITNFFSISVCSLLISVHRLSRGFIAELLEFGCSALFHHL